jgi:hypothetical protein
MRYVVEFIALLVGLPLPLRYCKAHPEILRGPPPGVFTSWSRGRRIAFVWVSLVITVVIAIPACLTSIFVMLDAESCTYVTSASGVCHSAIRFGIATGILCLIFIGTLKWTSLLARVQNFRVNPPVEMTLA